MLIYDLQEERRRLESIMQGVKLDEKGKPEGSLRITHGTKNPEFYHRHSTSDRSGTYIPKENLQLAKALAQKAYAEKFKKAITPKLELISKLITEYADNPAEAVYEAQNEIRKQLIKPYILTDQDFVAKWLAIPFEPNPKYQESRDQDTANGEKVRSKSEVIIADNLKMLGIPYKYEAPLKLKSGETIYPDFTCLNVRRRKVIYLEHFGRMGDPDYRHNDFFWKLKRYEAAGIIQGKRLIMTFEDEDHPFSFASCKQTIEELLLH